MIVLFTDFGSNGPYIGLVHAVLKRAAPSVPLVNLLNDAPRFKVEAGAHLLAALAVEFPPGAVFLAVVDPGVGGARVPIMVKADEKWYVGPDNGLLDLVVTRAKDVQCYEITWRPGRLSASFHARDLFAPVCARLALGASVEGRSFSYAPRFPNLRVFPQIIYLDHYGNCMTGVVVAQLEGEPKVVVGTHTLHQAETFCSVNEGQAFWYENSIGLLELAVNKGHAARELNVGIGTSIALVY